MTSISPTYRRRRTLAGALLLTAAIVVVILVLTLSGGGGSSSAPAAGAGAAALIPDDALLTATLSVDRSQPEVRQALAVAGRLPDFSLGGTVGLGRLGELLSGGRALSFGSQVSPWIGHRATVALLNSTTTTAGTLVIADVANRARARAFVRSEGAAAAGSYRGTPLLAYPNGTELAFVGSELVIGPRASLHQALDVGAGSGASLAAASSYQRATAGAPAGAVLSAYASASGVQRVLAGQSGVLGALGGLLSQPSLSGVSVALVPTAQGAQLRFHSTLSRSAAGSGFSPTLQNAMPSAASLMLDVTGLNHFAPQVLNAGSTAGLVGGIGPLLTRLGAALKAEGVNVGDLTSLFAGESAAGIVPSGSSRSLLVVTRTSDPARTQSELSRIEAPLARLFRAAGVTGKSAPSFQVRRVGGVAIHQLALGQGLQVDYGVFRGLVVISTGLPGIADVAAQTATLGHSPQFSAVLGNRPSQVTSLVYANLGQLLGAKSAGVTGSSLYSRLLPDLKQVGGIGLTSTRSAGESTSVVTVQINR